MEAHDTLTVAVKVRTLYPLPYIPDSYNDSTGDSDSSGGGLIPSSGASSKAIRTEIVDKPLLFSIGGRIRSVHPLKSGLLCAR